MSTPLTKTELAQHIIAAYAHSDTLPPADHPRVVKMLKGRESSLRAEYGMIKMCGRPEKPLLTL